MWKALLWSIVSFSSLYATSVGGAAPPPPITSNQLLQVAASLQMFVDELPDMPKLYGYTIRNGLLRPGNLTVGMFQTTWKFHRDLPNTTVFAYGTSAESATVPGPTIETIQNIPTFVTWENHLPSSHILPWDPTVPTAKPKNGGVPAVVHLHGGIDEPQSDGSALAWFTKDYNETGPAWTIKTYTYLNDQQLPGNLWYHDHALGLTRVNLLAGLIGAYTIRNPLIESSFNLPSGPFDRLLMIFDRSFYSNGSLYINQTGVYPPAHPQWQPEYFGDAIIVNGKAWPFMNVQKRKYRFRILNSANARYFRLSFGNNLSFIQTASDYSYLPSPVTVTNVLLSPSETADVIVDFKNLSGEILLTNDAPYPYPNGSAVDALNSKILKFVVQNTSVVDLSRVPARLIAYPKAVATNKSKTRYIALHEYTTNDQVTHLYINGKKFEDPVTETPVPGSTEIWKVINLTPDNHPLHIHLATFQAIEQRQLVNSTLFKACMNTSNDPVLCNISSYAQGPLVPVPANEMTWKNAVKIAPDFMVTVVVKFGYAHKNAPYAFNSTAEPGYVYHCHILDHEDNAMIRPLKLAF